MYLRKDTADKIIKEISMILEYDINIMDEKGAILASTDPSRVGMFHEGAFRILRNHLTELAVYEDDQYQGCRKGINLPIFLNEKIIGVIGITGEVSQVMKYGKILKKMTEILTMDLFSYHKKSQEEQARLFFINEWIHKEPSQLLPAFHDELRSYGFAEKDSYTVALLSPPSLLEETEISNHAPYLYGQNGDLGVLICRTDQIEKTIRFLQKSICNRADSSYLCTIGSLQADYTGVKHSYEQAQKLFSLKQGSVGFFCYENCITELIFHDVPQEYKEVLINQLLSDLNDKEKADFAKFMEVYIRHNGAIGKIAEELFVHKNTVQYKISKIQRKTGKDPRLTEDAMLLMLAARWIGNS